MKEILLTSSALILALLALRRLFRDSVPRRVQYALWGLVLLRLLVPVSLPAAQFSLLTAAEPVVGDLESLYLAPDSVSARSLDGGYLYGVKDAPPAAVGPATPDNTRPYAFRDALGDPAEGVATYKHQFPLGDLVRPVWYGGMALMACWLAASNLVFWRKLRRSRRYFHVEDCRYPVYLVERGLPSPCLFGILRPAIYLTPAAVETPERLRHVLAHEQTHARHGDPLWSLLRGVCLTVYWFDPLVWWAALASRADCELACDEGALRRLGEEERIPYGQTLLSLIPVGRGPGNPLLSATTMTAGKRQLKDRITRIAENRRYLGTALFAAAALTALACAVTFTGAAPAGPEALSEDEVAWFNEEFFNGENFNIRNQFLSSTYERPEDIDLFELFYNGTDRPAPVTEAERQDLIETAYGGEAPETDLTKIPRGDMDAVLREHTGLGLEDTAQVGLGAFCFLSAYDACYYFHGDTNYRPAVTIRSGEREGDLVRLHYADDFLGDGWKCVTLREVGDGRFLFVSNLPWNAPVTYPAAQLTIPLDGAVTPYEPQRAEVMGYPYDYRDMVHVMDPDNADHTLDPYCVLFYKDGFGSMYAGVQDRRMSSFPPPFLVMSGEQVSAGYFHGILGHDGFRISYVSLGGTALTDYYYLDGNGSPVLLARCGRNVRELDLDGDGEAELVSILGNSARLVCRREGKLYDLDIRSLLEENWPGVSYITFDAWDPFERCLGLSGQKPYAELDSAADHLGAATVTLHMALYYDGESLLLCADPRTPEGHIQANYDAPGIVVESAREVVSGLLEQTPDGPRYDDWRIGTLTGPFSETVCGQEYEIWQMDYQLHTTTPERVITAGAAYMDENGWCGSYRPAYLFFRCTSSVDREYVYTVYESDVAPGSPFFHANMVDQLVSLGEVSYDQLDGDTLYDIFRNRPDQLMEGLGTLLTPEQRDAALRKLADRLTAEPSAWNAAWNLMAEARLTRGGPEAWERLQEMVRVTPTAANVAQEAMGEIMTGDAVVMTLLVSDGGGKYAVAPGMGSGPYCEKMFTAEFDWEDASEQAFPSGSSLEVSSQDGETRFLFWAGSELVWLYREGGEHWFRVTPSSGDATMETIFDFMRSWYDEAEWEALAGNIVIPDRGQTRQEIAEAWVEAYTQTALQVTPGSKYAHSYERAVVRASPDGEVPETAFPEYTEGSKRFHFSYEEIFVLENEAPGTLAWNWAGNTGAYEGGGAPEGALTRQLSGFMYLTEVGWRCGGVGTGP